MAVVLISGLLAAAGVTLFRRHIIASRGSEATALIEGIRAAEHMYQAENHVYLNASIAKGGALWYPQAPVNSRSAWLNSDHLDYPQWRQLGMPVNKTVMFGYLLNAGGPGVTMPTLAEFKSPPVFAIPQLDWYVIQAKGDTDGNGVFAMYATTSLTNEIYVENDGD